MADTYSIIDPDNAADTDYTSLVAWESAAQTWGTSGDTNYAQCRSSSGTADGRCSCSGWNTGVNFAIVAMAGHEALKTGIDTSRYRMAVTNDNCLQWYDPNTANVVTGIQMVITSDNATGYRGVYAYNAASVTTMTNCRVHVAISSKTSSWVDAYVAFEGTIIANNCIVTFTSSGGATGSGFVGRRELGAYNCLVYNSPDNGYSNSYGDAYFYNCVAIATTDTEFGGSAVYSCAGEDGGGTDPVIVSDWSTVFEDYTNGNFTLLSGSSLVGTGIGPSTNANVPAYDIDGTTRSGATTDLGPDQYIIGASVCWGHDTGVTEDVSVDFSTWTGTGATSGSGDGETLDLDPGEYMISGAVQTGAVLMELLQNEYAAGDAGTLSYRTGSTQAACEAAGWTSYSAPFVSSGYVQVRVSN